MKENVIIQVNPQLSLEMIRVQGGVFSMGTDQSEHDDEKPAHQVRLADFYIGRYQVTQQLWQAVTGDNPSWHKGENLPVESVSWDDCQEFIKQLKKQTRERFRLPTEAEWEYAARGGIHSQGYLYSGSDRLKQVAWYDNNCEETQEVGMLLGNELKIHDMSGHVWEWCQDWFDGEYYQDCHDRGMVDNPEGAGTGVRRVLRGGSFLHSGVYCRVVSRGHYSPGSRFHSFGLRLALSFQLTGKPNGFH